MGTVIHKSRLSDLRNKKWEEARTYLADLGGWVLYKFNNLYNVQGVDNDGVEHSYLLHTEWEGRMKLMKLNGVCV